MELILFEISIEVLLTYCRKIQLLHKVTQHLNLLSSYFVVMVFLLLSHVRWHSDCRFEQLDSPLDTLDGLLLSFKTD